MDTNKGRVRLTKQAHILCSEKAEEYKTSMKAVASEAIFLLVRGDNRDKEQQTSIEVYEKRMAILSKRVQDNTYFASGTFILGVLTGGALFFLLEMLW